MTENAKSALTMDTIIQQLSVISRSGPPLEIQVEALETAIDILSALQDSGVENADSVRALLNRERRIRTKYETPAKATRSDGVWHCPECNHRVMPKHTHCHWCGKKIGGW